MSIMEDIKQRLDIVQVVSEYVKLQKAGRNYKALCPFHGEKDPSFFVFPERQSWHCFGACGTGGDVFSFIMRKEGLDFGQALRLLANKAGIGLTAAVSPKKRAEDKEKERLYDINEAAAEYYHRMLLNNPTGEVARNYLAQRNISLEAIRDFQLGYSPQGWDNLNKHLQDRGYEEVGLLAAGLLVERDDGTKYDRFRNRLIFPIRDIQGKVLGFGARALDDTLPKYLNSPQTLVFDKSSSLYGIERAKTAIRENDLAIITEGYIDVITAHQHGWKNVVASMGTAITDKQLATLKNLTRNLILALDADVAGEEAISRSGEVIERVLPVPLSFYGWVKYEDAHNAEVKILVLPQGKDPDEVIKEDISQWQKLIQEAKPIIDYIFDTVIAKVDLSSVRGKSSVIEKLLPLLSEMKDPIRQAHYMNRLAWLLKIDERIIADTLRRFKATEGKRSSSRSFQGHRPIVATLSSSSPLEQYCLALLLQYPELKAETTELSPDYFECSENRELFIKWQKSDDIDSLRACLDVTLHEYLENLLSRSLLPILKESEKARRETLHDCLIRLEEKRLKNMEAERQELLAVEAEMGGVKAQLAKLEEQGIEASKRLREIFIRQNHWRQRLSRRDAQ